MATVQRRKLVKNKRYHLERGGGILYHHHKYCHNVYMKYTEEQQSTKLKYPLVQREGQCNAMIKLFDRHDRSLEIISASQLLLVFFFLI